MFKSKDLNVKLGIANMHILLTSLLFNVYFLFCKDILHVLKKELNTKYYTKKNGDGIIVAIFVSFVNCLLLSPTSS